MTAITRCLSIAAFLSILLSEQTAFAQTLEEQVAAVALINDSRLITDKTATATALEPSAYNFSRPSLWWQQQQQGETINRRLIDNWHAYDRTISSIPHVDVEVNSQIWPLLNYLEQYAFITQFGESAKSYGYQLRIFMGNRLVGLHVCDFAAADGASAADVYSQENLPRCHVELDYLGQGSIRGGGRR